jgi:hypothetical protein
MAPEALTHPKGPWLVAEQATDKHPRAGGTRSSAGRRKVVRFGLAPCAVLPVSVRPTFAPLKAVVKDISTLGIGLICAEPIEPGAFVALYWLYGPDSRRRIIRAHVVRVAPYPRGGWVAGCVFTEPLRSDDIDAFRCQHRSAQVLPGGY